MFKEVIKFFMAIVLISLLIALFFYYAETIIGSIVYVISGFIEWVLSLHKFLQYFIGAFTVLSLIVIPLWLFFKQDYLI
ncbi:hypothetical protein [Cytobacillus horneckiae]|uniref:Uncharacterized protein n=1 Tax=Cytobacillus horneckiae TaxID=549687 RepID=A0A2N0ZAY3_9BACI|nr:hypothetical protein [Cytobacillus horneckiae]MEC1158724.1 hypothetical protein [Cytobacillus horneckiae]NRG47430.1 hypothetical protein [Bacillus sp. CRN 9]PKG26666.1 hypothetical protein CWS20_22730 [Cytobacillus horneckiae]